MAIKRGQLGAFAGLVFVTGAVGYYYLATPPAQVDRGVGGKTSLTRVPAMSDDKMKPIGRDEANRQVTRNVKTQQTLAAAGKGYIAPPVIQDAAAKTLDLAVIAKRPPLPDVIVPDPAKFIVPAVAKPGPTTDIAPRQADAPSPQTAQQNQQNLEQARNDVRTQIDAVTKRSSPIITVQTYEPPPPPEKKPAPVLARAAGPGGPGGVGGVAQAAYVNILAAKPGDSFYTTAKVGFNSDDPHGLPVFATIHDGPRPDDSYGPLDGAVLMGSVTYSANQASVVYQEMILADGRQAPVRAMAVTLDEVRPGVAQDIDEHRFSRYGGLVLASLLQGAGLVGQELIANNRSYYATGAGLFSPGQSSPGINWGQAGLAATAPLGQNLSSALGANFNRPSTKSMNGGAEIGVIFLQSVNITNPAAPPQAPQTGQGMAQAAYRPR